MVPRRRSMSSPIVPTGLRIAAHELCQLARGGGPAGDMPLTPAVAFPGQFLDKQTTAFSGRRGTRLSCAGWEEVTLTQATKRADPQRGPRFIPWHPRAGACLCL